MSDKHFKEATHEALSGEQYRNEQEYQQEKAASGGITDKISGNIKSMKEGHDARKHEKEAQKELRKSEKRYIH